MQKPTTNNAIDKFIGTWRLVKCTETKSKEDVFYPWGADAVGYIIYTAEGVMAVQIMRQQRKLFSGNDIRQAAAQDGQELIKDYNAYFGRFEVNEINQTVIHHIEGHLFPNLIGKDNIRNYRFYDNRLSLTTVGGNVSRELLWEKLPTIL
jgi:hypothetical protein